MAQKCCRRKMEASQKPKVDNNKLIHAFHFTTYERDWILQSFCPVFPHNCEHPKRTTTISEGVPPERTLRKTSRRKKYITIGMAGFPEPLLSLVCCGTSRLLNMFSVREIRFAWVHRIPTDTIYVHKEHLFLEWRRSAEPDRR